MNPIDYYTLQRLISQNFTLDDIQVLCGSLGVNMNDIPGNGILAKAYGIVPFMQQQGRIRDLYNALRNLKPGLLSEYNLDERTFRLPEGVDLLPTHILSPTLVEVPPDQVGARVVQLEVSDPEAMLLLKRIEDLQDRLVRLTDAVFQQKSYETLEQASRLLRVTPEKVDDWQLQKTRAEFLIRKTQADVYRMERTQEWRIAEVNSRTESERRRALDERRITWLVPLTILFYAVLVAVLSFYVFMHAGEGYVVPVLGIPLQILVWSSIGSLSALLFRYYKRERTSALIPEIRLILGRFWIGIVAGSVFYFMIRSGLFVLSNQVVDLDHAPFGQQQALWVLVWLVSFSDFIFERVIARVAGNVIGEDTDKTVTSILTVTTSEIADIIERATNEQLAEFRRLRAEFAETESPVITTGITAEASEPPAEDNTNRRSAQVSTSQESTSPKERSEQSSEPAILPTR